jgi:hypothetical protein
MTFLVIILAIRYAFLLLNRIGRQKEPDVDGWQDGPSEHNVWW